jgi:hypothetical protein
MPQPVRLDPVQTAQAAEMLARAFRVDPACTHIFPDEADRMRSMRALWDALIRFSLIYGEVWTTPELAARPAGSSPARETSRCHCGTRRLIRQAGQRLLAS